MTTGRLRSVLSYIPRIGLIMLMLLIPVGAFRPVTGLVDQLLSDLRFSLLQRNASQQVVFLAIDKESLDKVGVWPWPRSVYADILTVLSQSDPKDIFFDIDFSTPSAPQEDGKLAEALENAGGGVILPIFKQHAKAAETSTVELTRPIDQFGKVAWPAFANVELDDAGLVSHFSTSDQADGLRVQSVAAALASYSGRDGVFPIDFSIRPSTVPTYSVSDLLSGKVPPSRLDGKTVVIGAYATELKDIYPVPVHGALAGPLIHILATETILQNRLLTAPDQHGAELFLAAMVVVLALAARRASVLVALAAAGLAVLGVEAAAFWVQQSGRMYLETGQIWMIVLIGLCLFIGEKFDFNRFLLRRAFADRRLARTVLQQIIAESSDAVIVFDDQLNIIEASQSTELHWQRGNAKGSRLGDCIPSDLFEAVKRMVTAYGLDQGKSLTQTVHFSTEAGDETRYFEAALTLSPRILHLESGRTDHSSFVGSLIVRDQTAQRLHELELLRLSQTDELTGLLNRREFASRLGNQDTPVIVAAIGFHRFEVVAKVLGSALSDQLLQALAARLASLPKIHLVGRLGPNSFVVSASLNEEGAATRLIDAIAETFAQPVDLGSSPIPVDVRIGLFRTQTLAEHPSLILDYCAAALESAYKIGSHWWRAFDPELARRQERARKLENDMREGLRRGEFHLLYQPQVDLKTGAVRGAEALLRWDHCDAGPVSPAEFVPVAEASGFIRELGRFALFEACRQASKWPDHMTVAVNVSGIQIQDAGLLEEVQLALLESGLAPKRLHLEITESAFVEGSRAVLDLIGNIRAMGISVALDDFGTGYSSLSYMTAMPLDKLKIDQSFVKRLSTDPASLVIIQSVLSMAHGLNLRAIAEGIETREEWDILKALGCQEGQGYLFGRPMRSEDLVALAIPSDQLHQRLAG
ncbi:EAL domain-containing protein [Rhizobium rhizoryzae]|uniref:Putative signal transduction protein with EAL and GGDEF domain/CHASE2 domain-containing sensor protein n=1 Tax=Rhizobium rhizoryzae TaxID=451876 RepID=A0A7W6PRQ2_9HYPH|nr:EAL domain-containing protein [Rhizobium rhizoryzae]MBB4145465.1 putative signal transduction protein with EAL and GGDEF domain/CHASE2 domain-containing sensor protein [Rhizobium rhizoryzae]